MKTWPHFFIYKEKQEFLNLELHQTQNQKAIYIELDRNFRKVENNKVIVLITNLM